METAATQLSDDIRKYGLERYVLELETDGLTIVPPKVTGLSEEFLDRFTEMIGRGSARFGHYLPGGDLAWGISEKDAGAQVVRGVLLPTHRHAAPGKP